MLYIFIAICICIIILLRVLSKTDYTLVEPEERVDVMFTASLPQELQANSYNGEKGLLDILTVGVYDSEGNELIRKSTQTDGAVMDFKMNLAKKYTYNIVLWTHHGNGKTNNIGDMKSIKMLLTDNVAGFATMEQLNDFYTPCQEVDANQSSIHTVGMVCPLTQMNVDTIRKRAKATLKIFGVPASFYLFTKEMDVAERLTFDHSYIPSATLVADNIDNNCAAKEYLFALEDSLAYDSDTNT